MVEYFKQSKSPAHQSLLQQRLKTAHSCRWCLSIEELDLPTRIANALQKAGFETVNDLYATNREELAKVKMSEANQ